MWLETCLESNQLKAAKYLIAQAASVDTKDANGCTALDIATALNWKVWVASLDNDLLTMLVGDATSAE